MVKQTRRRVRGALHAEFLEFRNMLAGDFATWEHRRTHGTADREPTPTEAREPRMEGLGDVAREVEEGRTVYNASDIVNWYNGHPDYVNYKFDFSGKDSQCLLPGYRSLRLTGRKNQESASSRQ